MAEVTKAHRLSITRRSGVLWGLIGLVAVAVVAGAIAGARGKPVSLAADTPEGVTQAYLQAVFDRDFTNAIEHLADAVAGRCDRTEFRQAWIPENLTATLDEVRVDDADAEVRVRLRSVAGPVPLQGEYAASETFSLTRERGVWRISVEPWPLFDCGGPR